MENKKTTVVLGASMQSDRYAYMAAERLHLSGHVIKLVSIKKGGLFGEQFLDLRDRPRIENVHTVTVYIGTSNLDEWIDYILSLKPQRIILNPGTENDALIEKAKSLEIEVVLGCTLVMLSTNQY